MTNEIEARVGVERVLDQICHKEQLGIWANELASALSLSDFLKEDWTFDDSVDLDKEIAAQLRDIIGSALTHPEFDVLAKLQEQASEIEALRARLLAAEKALEFYADLGERLRTSFGHGEARFALLSDCGNNARTALSTLRAQGITKPDDGRDLNPEKVEVAAQAIYENGPSIGGDTEDGWTAQSEGYKHKARAVAHVVIAALYSPSLRSEGDAE